MGTIAYILLGLFGAVALVAILWRLASRGRSVPCPASLSWLVELDNPFTKTNRAATIVERLDVRPGMAVLDLGCGPGRLTIPIAREVGPDGEVVAMDIQSGMLQRAQEKARAANLTNIQFLQAGAGEGKLGRNRFDRSLFRCVEARRSTVGNRNHLRSAFPIAPNSGAARAFGGIPGDSVPRQSHCIHLELREACGLTPAVQ
jgi:SAM-dependent methyltransferase